MRLPQTTIIATLNQSRILPLVELEASLAWAVCVSSIQIGSGGPGLAPRASRLQGNLKRGQRQLLRENAYLKILTRVISGARWEVVARGAGGADLFIDHAGDRRSMIPEYEVKFGRPRVKQPNGPWRGVFADRKVGAKTGSTIVANDMAGPKRHRSAGGDVTWRWEGVVWTALPAAAILRIIEDDPPERYRMTGRQTRGIDLDRCSVIIGYQLSGAASNRRKIAQIPDNGRIHLGRSGGEGHRQPANDQYD